MLLGCNWMRRSQHRIEEAEVVCILNIKGRLLDFHLSWGPYIGTSSNWVVCGNVESHILYSIHNPSGSFTCECFCQGSCTIYCILQLVRDLRCIQQDLWN